MAIIKETWIAISHWLSVVALSSTKLVVFLIELAGITIIVQCHVDPDECENVRNEKVHPGQSHT